MSFLLDTDFCIHVLRGRPWARAALASVKPSDVAISAITLAELEVGKWLDPKRSGPVDAFQKAVPVLDFGPLEAECFGKIQSALIRSGTKIGDMDALIAATALANGRVLVTGNLKHFERVPRLKIADWEARPPRGAKR
jgi:tRNA(fMet)-specific endonuclease VapC